MRIGVLGTGAVGRAIATQLHQLGHEVTMGSRSAGNEALAAWISEAGDGAKGGDFATAAGDSELLFNCTAGVAKAQVSALLEAIGWPAESIVDLGGIEAARGTEMYVPLWLRLYGHFGDTDFNIALAR